MRENALADRHGFDRCGGLLIRDLPQSRPLFAANRR